MGLFNFGKKEKKENIKEKKNIKLNKRKYDRYRVKNLYINNFGKVLDLSKDGAAIEKDELDEVQKEKIDIILENIEIEAKVERETLKAIGVNFDKELEKDDIVKIHFVKPKRHDFKSIDSKIEIEFNKDYALEKIKAVINLMLELDDPNSSIKKFESHIEALPELESAILKKANSVESSSRTKIDAIQTAVTRIGFDEVKKIVYDYINEKVTLKNDYFEKFEHYEFYNIFKSSFFKKLAPLFAFKDFRSEGRSLLSTDTMGIQLLLSNSKNVLKNIYRSPKELYSYSARLYEEKKFGTNLLDLNKQYFVDELQLFKYLYDGYILANLSLYPYLEFNQSIMLSSRKLKFSYVAYLTFLSLEYVLSRDKRSGYILFNRLKRFGLDNSKAISFINEIISSVNNNLKKIGIKDKISATSFPSYKISIQSSFGKSPDIIKFIEKVNFVSKENIDRVAFRYEDSFIAMKFIENVINSAEFDFSDLPFCVLPVKNLKDDELTLEMFNGFDILIFKDIDMLPKNLFKDFVKLWKDFEGNIFVTYSTYSIIDFNQKELHSLIRDYIIDIPSCFENRVLYENLLEDSCKNINEVFNEKICDKKDFEDEIYLIESVYKKIIDKL